jgi:hypothetical protein
MWRYRGVILYAGVAAAALASGWGCRSAAGTASDPVRGTPVASPAAAAEPPPPGAGAAEAASRDRADGRSKRIGDIPTRPEQAPLVTIREIIDGQISLGRRVRVAGRCIAAGAGRSAGLWTLLEGGAQIEVRGLVPQGCPGSPAEPIIIFAQVEWRRPGGPERLLLRLPGQ